MWRFFLCLFVYLFVCFLPFDLEWWLIFSIDLATFPGISDEVKKFNVFNLVDTRMSNHLSRTEINSELIYSDLQNFLQMFIECLLKFEYKTINIIIIFQWVSNISNIWNIQIFKYQIFKYSKTQIFQKFQYFKYFNNLIFQLREETRRSTFMPGEELTDSL